MYTTYEIDGKRWIPLKRICEDLGIRSYDQQKKIKSDPKFDYRITKVAAKDGKFYKMVCIPEDQLELFKSSINFNRVNLKKKPQYTYILWDGKSDFIKIGKTSNPPKRLKSHQNSHKSLQMIYLIEGDKEDYFKKNWEHLRIDDNSEHWWITPQLIEAWEQFEDINYQFY